MERELDAARAAIRRAARRRHGDHGGGKGSNVSSADWFYGDDVEYGRLASVYRNPAAFYR